MSGDEPKVSAASLLMELTKELYTFVCGADGSPYAIGVDSSIAVPVAEEGRSGLRAHLAAAFHDRHGRVPPRNALAEAMEVIRGQATAAERCEIHLRMVRSSTNHLLIDLGDDTERYIVVVPGDDAGMRWSLEPGRRHGFRFRRTELTGALPAPDRNSDLGDLEELRQALNITDSDWTMVVGWMIAVLTANVPVPILLLTGEQGTGKTSTGRALVSMVDPSPVPVRSAPRDLDQWIVAANGSRVVCLDNISVVSDWLSDALCRAVTGEGLVKRRLYSNDELVVISMRRAIILTSIDAGATRGDLSERLLPVELETIVPENRLTEQELKIALDELRPRALAALLELTAEVLWQCQEGVQAQPRPRMADFADILAGLDAVTGWTSLTAYRETTLRTMTDTVAGDRLAEAMVSVARKDGTWKGTASDLLADLAVYRGEDKKEAWPRTARGLAGAVRRLAVPLRAVGVEVTWGRDMTSRWLSLTDRTNGSAHDANDRNDGHDGSTLSLLSEEEGEEGKPPQRTTVMTVIDRPTVMDRVSCPDCGEDMAPAALSLHASLVHPVRGTDAGEHISTGREI